MELLRLEQITCRFPGGIVANDKVDFSVQTSEVHALIGENGAGKSTLMKVAFGLQAPTEGTIYWKGQRVQWNSVSDAMKAGMGMIHQHFMLIPSMTVWENIVLGQEPTRYGQLDPQVARTRVHELSEKYGLAIDPDAYVGELSIGQQQRVEILKAFYRDIQLLILDEPTAVLTPQETEQLFTTLQKLTQDGLGLIFISHKLREVQAIADRITILRRGQKIVEGPTHAYTQDEMAAAMVGRPPRHIHNSQQQEFGPVLFAAKQLQILNERQRPAIQELSFEIHTHEIVGFAGIEGNGQSELLEALVGLRPLQQGELQLQQRPFQTWSPQKRLQEGLAHIPENRQTQGLILEHSIAENLILGRHHEASFLHHRLWLDEGAIANNATEQIERFQIHPPIPHQRTRFLSGGNQQKVVVAREFQRNAKLYIIAHPTRGVDIGAIEIIHQHILELPKKEACVLLFSSELPELLALCHRIFVLYEGRIVGECLPQETSETDLGLLMTGSRSALT